MPTKISSSTYIVGSMPRFLASLTMNRMIPTLRPIAINTVTPTMHIMPPAAAAAASAFGC